MAEFIVDNAVIVILASILVLIWVLWHTWGERNAVTEEEFFNKNKEVKSDS